MTPHHCIASVALALEIKGIRFGRATSTRMPMITRTTRSSGREKARMSVFINWFFKKIYIVIYKVLNINRIQFILALIVLQDI